MAEDEDMPVSQEEVERAGEIILTLLAGQKKNMEEKLAQTHDDRVDSMEHTRAMLEKHVGEKAFIASKQKESMSRSVKNLLDGELGAIVKQVEKEIGMKAFLSATARERAESLKRIEIDPDHFKAVQDAIGATVATHAIASDRMKSSAMKLAGEKNERVQRMKDAGDNLEKSDAMTSRTLRVDREKTQAAQLGSKDERAQHVKEAAEKLEKDEKFKERLVR